MTAYDRIAQNFVDGLVTPDGTPGEALSFQEVIAARQLDFPFLKEGVQALGAALMAKLGREFGLSAVWDSTTLERRQQGSASGQFRLQRRGKPDTSTAFTVTAASLDFNGQNFSQGQDVAISSALKAWAQPYFAA